MICQAPVIVVPSYKIADPALRRLGSKTARHDKEPSIRLIDAASTGLITRKNTSPGTTGRQAVYHAEYLARQKRRPLGATASEAGGHPNRAIIEHSHISLLIAGPTPYVIMEQVSRRERVRIARYNSYLGQLAEGKISPRAFEHRISSWRPIRGQKFLANPDLALAVLEQRRTSDEELFIYESGRAQ